MTDFRTLAGECLDESGLTANLLAQRPDDWHAAALEVPYLPVAYSPDFMEYQRAYVAGGGVEAEDISLVLYRDRLPAGLWPLSLRRCVDGQLELGSNEGPVLPPLFRHDLPLKSVKALVTHAIRFAELLSSRFAMKPWRGVEPYRGGFELGEWHTQLMRRGARASLRHELWVDLSLDFASIRTRFRRSYKALISSGTRQWSVGVLKTADAGAWSDFRGLHLAAAGRSTRSDESWNLQLSAIERGAGFLVFLRDEDGRMVGGGFFNLSRDEAVYAVGAYDRSLFSRPLGHVVQAHAIQEMLSMGLKWYRIGTRPYPSEEPMPTEKELTIAEFKEGFATHCFPCYHLETAGRETAQRLEREEEEGGSATT